MSADNLITLEINGKSVQARRGAMLIEITDDLGIYVPRFCYHKKLSVAANCRMCLVEVERAPKPLPACATPVMEGMKVHTRSPKAIAAQKGTMEFLLINHPLDCPICDQGGECELQDLAMGYGRDVSRFTERKRVVKDKDIGPLIATDMTRCIHCTRCVRFGEEIAGLRELGATGRGEHMEIGTYIAKSISSELSGNVIDLCPVGALTAKPSRYSGRSWEYTQYPSIAPHDAVGSNIYLHVLRGKVIRTVPRENEAINETWLSDRDRFSYEGIYSSDRALTPLMRQNGQLQSVEWHEALETTAQQLRSIINLHGPDAVGVLVSPTATVEEMYLLQKLARQLGIHNIDHRLRQTDFSDQVHAPIYPWLGQAIAELQSVRAALLIGSNIRFEQPLAGHRIRKAALAGAKIMFINPQDFDFRFSVAAKIISDSVGMVHHLAGVARAISQLTSGLMPESLQHLTVKARSGTHEQMIAKTLLEQSPATILLGNLAIAHPAFSQLRALAGWIAECSGARLGYLPEAANVVGGWLAGVLPHRLPAGKPSSIMGLDAKTMLSKPRRAYILFGIEPELDFGEGALAQKAMESADYVLACFPYASQTMKHYVHTLLPIGTFAETSGTFVNMEGRWQSFQGVINPLGDARPGWKVLRVIGNLLHVDGFEYESSQELLDELWQQCKDLVPDNRITPSHELPALDRDLPLVKSVPIYSVDALVRRAPSLQKTPLALSSQYSIAQPNSIHSAELAME